MALRPVKGTIDIPPAIVFGVYLAAILFIGWLIEPEVIQDYIRVILIGATAVMNLFAILAVFAHRKMGPRRRLPTWVVAGMASSWLVPLDWVAFHVLTNLGEPLTANSAVLFFSLFWAAFWFRELAGHVR